MLEKKHYWLATVAIHFTVDGQDQVATLNALVRNDEDKKYVNEKLIKRTQVQAQIQLAKSFGDNLPQVTHVRIDSLNYLGLMSEDEFVDTPDEEQTQLDLFN